MAAPWFAAAYAVAGLLFMFIWRHNPGKSKGPQPAAGATP